MVRFIPRVAASVLAVLAILVASVPAVGALGEPFTVTAPAPGETVVGGMYTFAGTGEPGATVEVFAGHDGFNPCATIGADGTWTCDIDIPDAPQSPSVAPEAFGSIQFVTTGASYGTASAVVPLFATPVQAPSLTGVPSGEPIVSGNGWGDWMYRVPLEGVSFAPSGVGEPGATITLTQTVFDESGVGTLGPPICSVTVAGDGAWACPDDLVTVPPLAGEHLRFTEVQLLQSIPGYTDRGTTAYTVQAAFEVTSPEWAVIVPYGGDTAAAFSGTGSPGATVWVGADHCATIDGAGNWSCAIELEAAPAGTFYSVSVYATVPAPHFSWPITIGEVTRMVVFEGPAGGLPDVPDEPHPVLAVPCVGVTSLRPVAGEEIDGEDLSDGCSCPASARFGDGLTPDPLVGAMLTIRDQLDAAALSDLAVMVEDHADPARGWRGEMEAFITWSMQVLAPEPGEMPVGADSAWADGLDIFTYTPDWWKVANGDATGCVTVPPPPVDAPPAAPEAPVTPPELARTGVSTTGLLLSLAVVLVTAGAALVAAGQRLSTRTGR